MQKRQQRGAAFRHSRALVFKVTLFDASAEGQQVAVAPDPLCQLRAGQSGGEYGEEVPEDQRIQFCRPTTHTIIHRIYHTQLNPERQHSREGASWCIQVQLEKKT